MNIKKTIDRILNLTLRLVRIILLSGFSFIILYPLIVRFSTSLMSEGDLFNMTVTWIPRDFSLIRVFYNYMEIAQTINYQQTLTNSLILSLLVSSGQLISCTVVGYGFGRFVFKGKGFIFSLVILTLLVPPQMIMIPLFLNLRFFNFFGLLGESGLNLLGTYWPFLLTTLTATGFRNGLYIYIARQQFAGMPKQLEEAAYIDGAGQLKTFYKIMLPAAIPALIVIFLFGFVWQWNDTYITAIYMRESSSFLPFALRGLAEQFDLDFYTREYLTIVNNTGLILFVAPLLLLYVAVQRYFVESVERTGIVG